MPLGCRRRDAIKTASGTRSRRKLAPLRNQRLSLENRSITTARYTACHAMRECTEACLRRSGEFCNREEPLFCWPASDVRPGTYCKSPRSPADRGTPGVIRKSHGLPSRTRESGAAAYIFHCPIGYRVVKPSVMTTTSNPQGIAHRLHVALASIYLSEFVNPSCAPWCGLLRHLDTLRLVLKALVWFPD